MPKERAREVVLAHEARMRVVLMAVGKVCTPLAPAVGGVLGSGLVHVLSRVSGHTVAVTESRAAQHGMHGRAQNIMVCAWCSCVQCKRGSMGAVATRWAGRARGAPAGRAVHASERGVHAFALRGVTW